MVDIPDFAVADTPGLAAAEVDFTDSLEPSFVTSTGRYSGSGSCSGFNSCSDLSSYSGFSS